MRNGHYTKGDIYNLEIYPASGERRLLVLR